MLLKATYVVYICYHLLKSKTLDKVNQKAASFSRLLHWRSLAEGGLSGRFKFRSDTWLTSARTAAGYSPTQQPEGYYSGGWLQRTTKEPYPFPKAPH